MSKLLKSGRSRKVRPRSKLSAIPFIEKLARTLLEEYRASKPAIKWLSGKTIQCRLLRESSVELAFNTTSVVVRGNFTDQAPHLSFAITRIMLEKLIDRKIIPSDAVFNGQLRVAGNADDLVTANKIFDEVVDLLQHSSRLKAAYHEFKNARLTLPSRGVSVSIKN